MCPAWQRRFIHVGAGGDGAQVFLNKQYGSIIWGIRLLDLPPALAKKHGAWVTIGVVQGPTEAKSMDSILESFVQWLIIHDPGMAHLRIHLHVHLS